jgi:hypothetical protein
MKRFLVAVAAALAVPAAVASTLPAGFDDNPSVVDAVAKARSTGKPVIVYYTGHNCQACGALDGWLVRGDIRQAFGPSYHFSMVFGDDLVPEERERWRATYSPRGAPAWVVLGADGSYLCTASGGFASATAALELHKLLSRATTRPADGMVKVGDGPAKPRNCNAQALGI